MYSLGYRAITTIIFLAVSLIRAESALLEQELRALDKVELHLHLGGAWPREYLTTIATPEQCTQLDYLLDKLDDGMHYHEAFKVFDVINTIVNTDEKVENGVAALCKSLADDGVIYAELRTGARDLGSGLDGYVQAVLRGIARGCAQTRLIARVILSVRRDTPTEIVEQTIALIDAYCDSGIVGLDISGISTQGDGSSILQVADRVKQLAIPITLHIGESPQESSAQQMLELQTLMPQRVGHCVHLCDQALAWIREHKIPVELCPTSAVKVRMIKEYDQHPVLQLLRDGHPVVICTDDPLIFRTTLSAEYTHVARSNGLDIHAIEAQQKIAFAHAFGQKN